MSAESLPAEGQSAALAAQGAISGMDQLGLQGILGLLNAEANRIGATGMHAQGLGQIGQSRGGLFSGLLGGLFG